MRAPTEPDAPSFVHCCNRVGAPCNRAPCNGGAFGRSRIR
jgi:hypothetical protein